MSDNNLILRLRFEQARFEALARCAALRNQPTLQHNAEKRARLAEWRAQLSQEENNG